MFLVDRTMMIKMLLGIFILIKHEASIYSSIIKLHLKIFLISPFVKFLICAYKHL